MKAVLSELRRVVEPAGEVHLMLNSKNNSTFTDHEMNLRGTSNRSPMIFPSCSHIQTKPPTGLQLE